MGFFRRRQHADETAALPESPYTTQATTSLQWEFGFPEEDSRGRSTGLDSSLYTLQTSSNVEVLTPDDAADYRSGNRVATPLTKPWRSGEETDVRLEATRNALDHALEQWWSEGELPPRPLLRDGLLALAAGHDLDEGQRSLLLRAALTYQRGMVTALRYQTDSERTAFMIKEMLLNLQFPFPPALVWRLSQEDDKSSEWVALLIEELRYELPLVEGLQLQQTQATLDYLEGKKTPQLNGLRTERLHSEFTEEAESAAYRPMHAQPYWSYGRLIVMALLALLTVGTLLTRWQSSSAATVIMIPAGLYPIRSADDAQLPQMEELAAFTIDRTEVTNQAYQRCYRAGVCPVLPTVASLSRPRYASDAAFANFPVVNVNWEAAQTYCAWQGKQLPTALQWQVAASVAPATRRAFRYPWGDSFDRLLANTAASALGDIQPVGSYHPTGDSGFGLMDMAGNVAEWTATPVSEEGQAYIIKGGSFQDDPPAASVTAQQTLERQFYAPWLGFRCSVALME